MVLVIFCEITQEIAISKIEFQRINFDEDEREVLLERNTSILISFISHSFSVNLPAIG